MTIKNLTDESRFTKEQLIAHITPKLTRIKPHSLVNDNLRNEALMNKRVLEIALAALTAPDYIPPHVLDAMSNMCDGGFNAQGIWDLCRESIMPPEPCPRCGTVSDRPDSGHYCHVGTGQCGICAECVPQIDGGSGFSNCAEAHAAEIGQQCIAAIEGADANA